MKSTKPYVGIYFPRDSSDAGHLTIAGKESELRLVSKESWSNWTDESQDLHGTLDDGTRASLLKCVQTHQTTYDRRGGRHYESGFFPHYVVLGEEFISSTEAVIRAVHYHFENAHCLVGGYRTFRSLIFEPNEIRRILEVEHLQNEDIPNKQDWDESPSEPQIGEYPQLLYCSGVREIVACETDVCSVTLTNNTSRQWGGSEGIGIENQIAASLKFGSPKSLDEAIAALHTLHRLFELTLGRRQRYLWISLELEKPGLDADSKPHQRSERWWSYCDDGVEGETKPTSNVDILIDPERRPKEFATVAAGWLTSTSDMGEARSRFATAFHSHYTVDRIVGAANMFDLLPGSRVPRSKQAVAETQAAVDRCRAIFRALPDSFARQSVLSALGRTGAASLRDKVLDRADILIAASGDRFPEIHIACSQAVLCRNHYVHGSDAGFDYRKEFSALAFLTHTLEFVFATSDLIELGWDFDAWCAKRPTMKSHDFGTYLVSYNRNLIRLKALLQN